MKRQKAVWAAFLASEAPTRVKGGGNPGFGHTRQEAEAAACYWASQLPYLMIRPLSRAPAWVREYADWAFESNLANRASSVVYRR